MKPAAPVTKYVLLFGACISVNNASARISGGEA
jgi:hypothetical protein